MLLLIQITRFRSSDMSHLSRSARGYMTRPPFLPPFAPKDSNLTKFGPAVRPLGAPSIRARRKYATLTPAYFAAARSSKSAGSVVPCPVSVIARSLRESVFLNVMPRAALRPRAKSNGIRAG